MDNWYTRSMRAFTKATNQYFSEMEAWYKQDFIGEFFKRMVQLWEEEAIQAYLADMEWSLRWLENLCAKRGLLIALRRIKYSLQDYELFLAFEYNWLPEMIFLIGIFYLFSSPALFNSTKSAHVSTIEKCLWLLFIFVIFMYFCNFQAWHWEFKHTNEFFTISPLRTLSRFLLVLLMLLGLAAYYTSTYMFGAATTNSNLSLIIYLLLLTLFLTMLVCSDSMLGMYIVIESITFLTTGILKIDTKDPRVPNTYLFVSILATVLFLYSVLPILKYSAYSSIFSALNISSSMPVAAYDSLLIYLFIFFAIKIGSAPFLIWVLDVYSKVSSLVFYVLMVVVKSAFLFTLLGLYANTNFIGDSMDPGNSDDLAMPDTIEFSSKVFFVIMVIAVASMLSGIAAFSTFKIRDILIFSSANQIGYIFLGLSVLLYQPVVNTDRLLLYIYIYIVVYLFSLAILLIVSASISPKIDLNSDMAQFGSQNYFIALLITLILLSFGGVPVLVGFFSKFFLFLEIFGLASQLGGDVAYLVIGSLLIGFATSAVMVALYLRLITSMFFPLKKIFFKPLRTISSMRVSLASTNIWSLMVLSFTILILILLIFPFLLMLIY